MVKADIRRARLKAEPFLPRVASEDVWKYPEVSAVGSGVMSADQPHHFLGLRLQDGVVGPTVSLFTNFDRDLLLSSDSVSLIEKRICHPDRLAAICDAARASALARSLALSFLVGGLSADAYFFAVFLAMPRSRAIARRENPCSLTNCTASHRACGVCVGIRCNW